MYYYFLDGHFVSIGKKLILLRFFTTVFTRLRLFNLVFLVNGGQEQGKTVSVNTMCDACTKYSKGTSVKNPGNGKGPIV